MNNKDHLRLRELAHKYAEYACGEAMDQRREKWRLHNDLEEKTFPFHIEDNGEYLHDLMPPLECGNQECRDFEKRLLIALVQYETVNDDRIIPDRFIIDWETPTTNYLDEPESGDPTVKPIQNLEADFDKLRKREIRIDKEATARKAELAMRAFDGLLKVEVGRLGSLYSKGITNRSVDLMGMENLYLEMAMNPDAVHRLFEFLVDDNLTLGQWEEDQGLLTLNHDGNQGYCSGSCLLCSETASMTGEKVLSTDRYGYLESQESVGISADMFDEFLMPHLTKLARKFKFLKFGCCEPVHRLLPMLKRLNGLRKVSVSPWCDIDDLAENCPTDVIWSRKPVPMKLCGDKFDLNDLRGHLRETVEAGKDHFIEFVFRDTCALNGGMRDRIDQTCAMIRDLTGHQEGTNAAEKNHDIHINPGRKT